MTCKSDTSLAEEIALDTLSVLYLSSEHTAQFYILEMQQHTGSYTNFLYIAEPKEDTEKVLGAGVICVSGDYTHTLLLLLFPVGTALILPTFLFESE